MNNNLSIKTRQSNLELLRIIAIFLIMVVHATYYTFGMPQPEEIRQSPLHEFFFIGIKNVSVVCVDIFVLLSGWFGVHPKFKSIGGLIFQCIFFRFLLSLIFPLLGLAEFSISQIGQSLVSYPHFVVCYTVMYMLTPALNAFIEHSSKKNFARFLLVYYLWAFIFGWLLWKDEGFQNGNTTLSFIGLYMLARYVKLHTNLPNYSATFWGTVWLLIVSMVTTVTWGVNMSGLNDHLGLVLTNITGSYLAPNVIAASLCLILCFSKLNFSSNFINWLAISAFASVLLHGYMMDEIYVENLRYLYNHNSLLLFVILAFGLMIGYLFLGAIIDKARIWIWNRLSSIIQPVIDNI